MPFIGNQPTQGRFIELDSLTASATDDYTLQLNGANFSPESVNNLLVSINGVIQGSSTMSLNGAVLTVGATLSSSDTIDFVRVFGNVGTVSTPTDGSVTANKIGTGAVTSAKIADGTIVNADINASAGIDGSKLGTGAVLQTVVQQEDGATSFTASGTNDVIMLASNAGDSTSHLSLSITPKSVNSKILLTACVFHEVNTTTSESTLWSFYRDSTKLSAPIVGSRRSGIGQSTMGYWNSDADSTADVANYHYYDSPNTTSAITYAVSFNQTTSGVVLYLNRTVSDTDSSSRERGISILIAQEIGG